MKAAKDRVSTSEEETAAGLTPDEATGAEGAEAGPEAPAAEETAKAAEYLDSLQRLQADFENYRKRVQRDQQLIVESASEAMISKLLPLLDNFERAVFVGERTKDTEGLIKGVEMVYAEFLATLEKEGLEEVPAVGQPFDPSRHEAVMEVEPEGSAAPGDVVDILRKGYSIRGRLIRPAMVKVARHD